MTHSDHNLTNRNFIESDGDSPTHRDLSPRSLLAIVSTLLIAVAVFTPVLWLGGVIEPVALVSTCAAAVAMALWCIYDFSDRNEDVAAAASALPLLIAIWAVITIVTGAWLAISIVSPWILPNVDAAPLLIARRWAAITLGVSIIYVVARLPRKNIRGLLFAFAILVVFVAGYGLYGVSLGAESVLGVGIRADVAWTTGTFGNRNLFAAFIAIATPVAAAVVGTTGKIAPAMRWSASGAILIITGIALVSSASRTGVAAGIVSVALWAGIVRLDRVSPVYRLFIRIAPVLLIIVAGLWFGLLPLVTRYIETTNASGRFEAWAAMFNVPLSNFVFGIGPGQFAEFFPKVQPYSLSAHYYYLHNDWLQFFFEFGAIVSIAVFALIVVLILRLRKVAFSIVQKGALAGVMGGLISASADFPLHILGTSLSFCLCIGVLLNPHIRERHVESLHRKKKRRRRRRSERAPSKSSNSVVDGHDAVRYRRSRRR